ncbi:unnamed protein product [Cochlearia groenlandica]
MASNIPEGGLVKGSVVRFGLKNSEFRYQGTVSTFNPKTNTIFINNVTRELSEISETLEPDQSFLFWLWETKDFQVIQVSEQSLRNTTNTDQVNVQNTNDVVGATSSSTSSSASPMLIDDAQIGSSNIRNRDSTNTRDDEETNREDAIKRARFHQ